MTVDQLADTIEKFLLNVWFGPASAYVNGSARTPPLVQPIREEKLESTSNCVFR